jgi:hypothetical protein
MAFLHFFFCTLTIACVAQDEIALLNVVAKCRSASANSHLDSANSSQLQPAYTSNLMPQTTPLQAAYTSSLMPHRLVANTPRSTSAPGGGGGWGHAVWGGGGGLLRAMTPGNAEAEAGGGEGLSRSGGGRGGQVEELPRGGDCVVALKGAFALSGPLGKQV